MLIQFPNPSDRLGLFDFVFARLVIRGYDEFQLRLGALALQHNADAWYPLHE